MSNRSMLLDVAVNINDVEGERHKEIAKEAGRSNVGSTGTKSKRDNGSVGRTFGVGTAMLMMSQPGTGSISSGSWEWRSVRSQSSADIGPDSDDDLSMADKDMNIFEMVTETSDVLNTVQATNKTRDNASAVNQQLTNSYDDSESLSLVSSVFDYDSDLESSEASATLKFPPLERLLRTRGENMFSASKRGSVDRNNIVPRINRESSSSPQSMDEVPISNNSMGQWSNTESLVMEAPASKKSWVLGYNSGA